MKLKVRYFFSTSLVCVLTLFVLASHAKGQSLSMSSLGSDAAVKKGVVKTLGDILKIRSATVTQSINRFSQSSSAEYCLVTLKSSDTKSKDASRALLSLTAGVLVATGMTLDDKVDFLSCAFGSSTNWEAIASSYGQNPNSEIQDIRSLLLRNVQQARGSNATPVSPSKSRVNSPTPGLYQGVLDTFTSLFAIPQSQTDRALQKFANSYGTKYCGIDSAAFRSTDTVRNFVNIFASVLTAPIPVQDRSYFFTCVFDSPQYGNSVIRFSQTGATKAGQLLQNQLYKRVQALSQNRSSFPSTREVYITPGHDTRNVASTNPNQHTDAFSQSNPSTSVPVNVTNTVPASSPMVVPQGHSTSSTSNNNNNMIYPSSTSTPIIIPSRDGGTPTIVIAQNGGSAQQPVENKNSVDVAQQQQQQQQQSPPMMMPYPYYPPPQYPQQPYYPPQQAPAPAPQVAPQQPQQPRQRRPQARRPQPRPNPQARRRAPQRRQPGQPGQQRPQRPPVERQVAQ